MVLGWTERYSYIYSYSELASLVRAMPAAMHACTVYVLYFAREEINNNYWKRFAF